MVEELQCCDCCQGWDVAANVISDPHRLHLFRPLFPVSTWMHPERCGFRPTVQPETVTLTRVQAHVQRVVGCDDGVIVSWAPNAPSVGAKEVLVSFPTMDKAQIAAQRLHLTLLEGRTMRLGWVNPPPAAWVSIGPVRGAAAARRFFLQSLQAQEHLLRFEHDSAAARVRMATGSEAEGERLMQYFADMHFEGQALEPPELR